MGTTFRVEFEDELEDFIGDTVDDVAQRIETLIGAAIGLPCFVEPEGYGMSEHLTTIQDCFSSEGDYYAPSCTCGWESFTTDDEKLANRLANEHSLTGDMAIGQDWEEYL